MKVQDIAKDLGVSIPEFMTFLRQNGVRRPKPSLKLDPGATVRYKRMYKLKQEEKKEETVLFEKKTIEFTEESIKVSALSELDLLAPH